ncbi:hypothetical protein F4778DRAFT_655974 [Xylariomycetidae sp. FL2044]|nr:hypothetical protein F4778DRAFT_655974 [Xylariomycetidae sp. FL2044]
MCRRRWTRALRPRARFSYLVTLASSVPIQFSNYTDTAQQRVPPWARRVARHIPSLIPKRGSMAGRGCNRYLYPKCIWIDFGCMYICTEQSLTNDAYFFLPPVLLLLLKASHPCGQRYQGAYIDDLPSF